MSGRLKFALVVAVLFVLANLGGAGYAAMQREWLHTCGHVVLVFAGEYAVWQILRRRRAIQY